MCPDSDQGGTGTIVAVSTEKSFAVPEKAAHDRDLLILLDFFFAVHD